MGSSAWPAALYAAGCDSAQMELACMQARRMGKRMLVKTRGGVKGKKAALYTAEGLHRLLQVQTSGRLLALCPRKVMFPLRSHRTGYWVFASQGCSAGNFPMSMQASAAFAARAALGLPPFLEPVEWMGTPLLPTRDQALGVRLLFSSGAQRILIAETQPQAGNGGDALLLTSACMERAAEAEPDEIARMTIRIPESIGTLSFDKMVSCMEWGQRTAANELDSLFETMGMAGCRVLAFRKALHPQ